MLEFRFKVLLTRLALGVLHAFVREWLARSHYHLLTFRNSEFSHNRPTLEQ